MSTDQDAEQDTTLPPQAQRAALHAALDALAHLGYHTHSERRRIDLAWDGHPVAATAALSTLVERIGAQHARTQIAEDSDHTELIVDAMMAVASQWDMEQNREPLDRAYLAACATMYAARVAGYLNLRANHSTPDVLAPGKGDDSAPDLLAAAVHLLCNSAYSLASLLAREVADQDAPITAEQTAADTQVIHGVLNAANRAQHVVMAWAYPRGLMPQGEEGGA